MQKRKTIYSIEDDEIITEGIRVLQPRFQVFTPKSYQGADAIRGELLRTQYDGIIISAELANLSAVIGQIKKSKKRGIEVPNHHTPIFVASKESRYTTPRDLDEKNVYVGHLINNLKGEDDRFQVSAGGLVQVMSRVLGVEYDYVPKPRRDSFSELNDRTQTNPNYNSDEWENK